MKLEWLVSSILLTCSMVTLGTNPTRSEEISTKEFQKQTPDSTTTSSSQQGSLSSRVQSVKSTAEIWQIPKIQRPIPNAQILVQTPTPTIPAQKIVQVTAVKANPTNKGVEVILQTSLGEQLQITNRSAVNSFIVDIPNAQLRLPSGEAFTFRSDKPIAGITGITVINFDANTIRVTVTGEAGVPTVELFDSPNEGLIFSVASAAASSQPSAQPQTQPNQSTSETQPTQPSASSDEPIELVVTGEQDGYRVGDSSTPTKTDTPLRDIPQSIQVIPRQLIKEQRITRISDALRNVSGIQEPASTTRNVFDVPIIRGFTPNSDAILRNGLRERTSSRIPSETANLERIEVLKGPASVLYGQGSLGGTVNLVTKQPLSSPYYSVEASVGSFDFYRSSLDLSGPLTSDKTLLYRLNAAVETSGSFVDFLERQRYFVSPVLTWQIDRNTKISFESEYLATQQPDDSGLPARGTVLSNPNGKIPRNRNIGEPFDVSESGNNRNVLRVGYNFEHRFNEDWQVRNAFQASLSNYPNNRIYILPTSLSDDGRLLSRTVRTFPAGGYDNTYSLDNYVVGKFKTGSIQHQIVAGFDLFREAAGGQQINRSIAPLDLFNPVYTQTLGGIIGDPSDDETTSDSLGFYLQDQIALFNNLKLLLGGRFDIVNQTFKDFIDSSNNDFQQNEAFSPRVGIVYQPIPAISLYASYSRSFQQVIGTTFDNSLFQPEKGTQYEVGIKTDLSDKVSATLAFYDLTRSNVLTNDPDNPGESIQTGEQKSQGIELNIGGEILPGLSIIGGYAYTDASVIKDTNPQLVDNILNNVPKHAFTLWTTYKIAQGDLQGLGFGLGLYYVGDRQGDLANTFELPSYLRTDAAVFYERNKFRVALNIRNLFDIDYYASAQRDLAVYLGEPLTLQGTVSWEF
ncbi:TonB-dependent siderophore receptor [Nostoc sp.]|uniref:TonB-dependent siderophore receptor n=1 Tax=Nostoc sp. TaxID=1180 RepID=UPI002FFB4CD0